MRESEEPQLDTGGPAGGPPSRPVDWGAVVMALGHGVLVVDEGARVVACNPVAERALGLAASDLLDRVLGELPVELVAGDGSPVPVDAQAVAMGVDGGVAQRDVVVGVRNARGVRWLSVTAAPMVGDGAARSIAVSLVDVSENRARELALEQLSQRDDLTGLPNRRCFVDLLERHLASQRREDRGGAVLVIDLDRFKELNDAFGHAAGDRLLVQVARAVRERVREDDVVARLSGDEFAVLLRRATAADATDVAQALVDRLEDELVPAPHGGTRPLSASIGVVALAGAATGTAERALGQADSSMYRAKAAGRAGWRIGAEDRPGVGDQLVKRSRQLALANALGSRLAGMSDVVAIAEVTVEELRRAFGYHLSAVIRLRPDDRVEALAVHGASFDALRLRGWNQPRDAGLIGRCLRERTPVLVNDVRAESHYQETPETTDVCAELVVPLVVEGDLWGAINIEELAPDAFDHDDVILLSTLANQVSAALHASILLERLARAEAAVRRLGGAQT